MAGFLEGIGEFVIEVVFHILGAIVDQFFGDPSRRH